MSVMAGAVSDWQCSYWIDQLVAGVNYASAHTSNPLVVDPLACELPGISYARAQSTFARTGARTMVSTRDLTWWCSQDSVITHIGVFDAPVAGHLRCGIQLPNPVTVLAGGYYLLAKGDLYWSWP